MMKFVHLVNCFSIIKIAFEHLVDIKFAIVLILMYVQCR